MLTQECIKLLGALSHHSITDLCLEVPIFRKMEELMQKEKELIFILPAFPAKSPSPQKTSGIQPDMGEVVALMELNELCENISRVYAPGARLLICSDGRVFSDVVGVSDQVIDQYALGIAQIIRDFKLHHLSTLSMDDIYPGLEGDELRGILLKEFGKPLEEIKNLVQTDLQYQNLFNGIHRFLIEDQKDLHPEKTKSQICKETKRNTYELLRRSDAWSALLHQHYADELRLSIHPYPLHHEKFGIRMIRSSEKWATPWHNVLVKTETSYQLMHHREALNLNAKLMKFKEKYVYFEA